ncbi:MAG: LuxR C-terminal-related transcriptional regulator, partial [Coriobacteriia bacterium]|nr:LuxR C-terminal-related transcriptional regulator [Coriobacteriia bacterium]
PLQMIAGDADFLQSASGLASFIWFNTFTNDLTIHPLYLEFLNSKRDILSEDETQEVYRFAAQWCDENNFFIDAVYYYAQSFQYEAMMHAFFSHPFQLSPDTSEYFLHILESMGSSDADGRPDPNAIFLKSCFIPLMLVGMGRYEQAQELLLKTAEQWEDKDDPLALVILSTTYSTLSYLSTYLCVYTHRYDGAQYLQKSIEYYQRGSIQPAKATGAFINANTRSFVCSVGVGADLQALDRFLEYVQQSEVYTAQTAYGFYAGAADLVACEYAYFKNQQAEARKHAYRAMQTAREKKQYSIVALAEKYLLSSALQEGNVALVKDLLQQLGAHLDNPDFCSRQLYYDLYVGMFYARIGLLDQVPRWFVMSEAETSSELRLPIRELWVNAYYHIAAKNYQQALNLLLNSYPRKPHERFIFGEIRLTLLTAIARLHTGDTAAAVADLEKAYELSFEGVFEMFFIELGKDLHPLLVLAGKEEDCSIDAEWLKSIDRKASIYDKKRAIVANAFKNPADRKNLPALSDREREVLIDLYHGLSRDEIAENRHLSINTVKKALQSIYRKLGAGNSIDAIRIALERKLIT